MTTGWAVAVGIAVVAGLASAGVGLVLLQRLSRLLKQQQVLAGQLRGVDDAVFAIEARLNGMPAPADSAEARAGEAKLEIEGESFRGASIDAEIAPEIQAAIAAAAVAAAGNKARVQSMRLVKAEAERSAWSQQGRMQVQTSHNVRAPR